MPAYQGFIDLEIVNYLERTYEFYRIARYLDDYQFTVFSDFHFRNRKTNLCVLTSCELCSTKNDFHSFECK